MGHPFENIPAGKLESLTLLLQKYAQDESPIKADLMCGVYQTEAGQPFVLPSVKLAKQRIFDDPNWDHDYPPSHLGEQQFRDASVRLLFGADSDIVSEERVASMQTLGGSGACHMGASFLRRFYKPTSHEPFNRGIYLPAETWVNHANVFHHDGLEPSFLPYYSPTTHGVDFTSFHTAISSLPPQSIIVLQVCGNNPTGCDLTLPQWSTLASTILSRHHCVFLDVSYMGFISGNAEEDCAPVRLLAEKGIPLLVAATYGKAFGLYGERVGHLCITAPSQEIKRKMEDQMKLLARAETGAQPRFGARVVSTILTDGRLRRVWETDLGRVAKQLDDRRERLRRHLGNLGVTGDWSYITEQKGMFLYTGFTAEQVTYLREKHHVYLQSTGRISIAGLNSANIAQVARSIKEMINCRV